MGAFVGRTNTTLLPVDFKCNEELEVDRRMQGGFYIISPERIGTFSLDGGINVNNLSIIVGTVCGVVFIVGFIVIAVYQRRKFLKEELEKASLKDK